MAKQHDTATLLANIEKEGYFYVTSDYKTVQVKLDDIYYVKGEKDYVRIVFRGDRKPITCLLNMRRVAELLPKPHFMRIHRSYIINMDCVSLIDRFRVVIDEQFVPISNTYKEEFLDYLNSHTLA